jgi:cytochrome b561
LLAISAFGKMLGRWPRDAHNLGAKLILAIVILHVAAAVWHQFIRKDGLLARMLPARRFAAGHR